MSGRNSSRARARRRRRGRCSPCRRAPRRASPSSWRHPGCRRRSGRGCWCAGLRCVPAMLQPASSTGHADRERAAAAWSLATRLDAPLVHLDEPPREREPDAEAARADVRRRVRPARTDRTHAAACPRESRFRVRDRDHQFAARASPGAGASATTRMLPTARRELHRVVQDVRQHLHESRRVDVDHARPVGQSTVRVMPAASIAARCASTAP